MRSVRPIRVIVSGATVAQTACCQSIKNDNESREPALQVTQLYELTLRPIRDPQDCVSPLARRR